MSEARMLALRSDLMRVAELVGLPRGYAPPADAYDQYGQVSASRVMWLITGRGYRGGNRWAEAMRKLYLQPASEHRPTRDEVIEDLRRVSLLLGNPYRLPSQRAYKQHGRYDHRMVVKVLLPDDVAPYWSLLAVPAGFEPADPTAQRAAAVASYRMLAEKLGYEHGGPGPTREEWREYCEERPFFGERVMGGFNELVREAGYSPRRHRRSAPP